MDGDRRTIACNYVMGISPVSESSLAYVLDSGRGMGGERIRLLARSRSGRWIDKWENSKRLHNFRWKTIPPEHPLYQRVAHWLQDGDLKMLQGNPLIGQPIGSRHD